MVVSFDITLVLCTCGRVQEIADFLEALRSDTPTSLTLQIIVVDQNFDDRLDPVVAQYAGCWTMEHVKTDFRGICLARNYVWDKIQGRIVAFPDDDCLYLDHTLENVVRFFDTHPEAGAVVGIWDRIDAPDFSGRHFMKRLNMCSLFKSGEAFVQFFRRETVMRVGQFDPDFGPGPNSKYPYGGDDSDYLLRVVQSGVIACRCSDIHVVHPRQDTAGFAPQKIAGYGISRMMLLKKHACPLWFQLANLVYPLARLVGSVPRSYRYWWSMFRGRLQGFRR